MPTLTTTIVWRDAARELPERYVTVLMHVPTSDDPVWMGYFNGKEWRTEAPTKLAPVVVTHWALPKPPTP